MTTSAHPLKRIYHLFTESIKSEERDYTTGSLPKAVFLLAVPMILELSLESVFAVVDIFFVSKLGPNAIATVGLTESVITLVYSVSIGLSTAATAIIARRVGEKQPQSAALAAAQSLTIGLGISALLSVAGIVFGADILRLMGAKADVVAEGTVFTQIMLGSNAVIMLLFLINGIFRGAGDAAMAMKSLWIASIINIVLCPILIHFLGLKGAAIATVIGRGSGVAYQCFHLFKGGGIINLQPILFKWHREVAFSVIKIAWPATLQFIIASGSWIVLAKIVAEAGGTNASAGYQIAIRNVVFFILPAWGMSNAAATLVGQNLGAQKVDRAVRSVWLCVKYNTLFMGFVMVLFVLFAEPIIYFFTQDAIVVRYGAQALRIMGYGYIFYGIGMVLIQALNGAGDTRTPTWINLAGFWFFQVPLAYVLAYVAGWKELGAFWAVPIAETLIALMAWYYFQKGKWKMQQV